MPAVLVMGLQRKRRAAKGQISGPEGNDEADRILQNREKADDKSRGDQSKAQHGAIKGRPKAQQLLSGASKEVSWAQRGAKRGRGQIVRLGPRGGEKIVWWEGAPSSLIT